MSERNIPAPSATPRPIPPPLASPDSMKPPSTTAVPAGSALERDMDTLFPGECWFFYWKTSAALWESKLDQLPAGARLWVPINWAFHSETGDTYDFADLRPETDLKNLLDLAQAKGRDLIFLVPLGPCPFLPNGGLPVLLARILAFDRDAHPLAFADAEGNLHRFYSFFDKRIFKAYSKFVRRLGHYLSSAGVNCDVLGFFPGHLEGERFRPYLLDSSSAFKSGLAQFVQIQREEKSLALTPELQQQWEVEFAITVNNFYYREAQAALKSNWEGVVQVNFLGGSPHSLFARIHERDTAAHYFLPLLEAITHGQLPCSILLPARLKRGALQALLQDVAAYPPVSALRAHESLSDEGQTFQWALLFEVFSGRDADGLVDKEVKNWNQLGLLDYLKQTYANCFRHHSGAFRPWHDDERHLKSEIGESERRIFFFQGRDLSESLFRTIVTIFTRGGKVVLNSSGLKKKYWRKLEAFWLENDLQVERAKYRVAVQNVAMGEGRFLMIEADALAELPPEQMASFWRKILGTFKIRYLPVPAVEGVFKTWKCRTTRYHELDYEEIHQLNLYNPTSYKKKVRIPIPKDFRPLKVDRAVHAKYKSQSDVWEIELWPEGSLAVDFGVLT